MSVFDLTYLKSPKNGYECYGTYSGIGEQNTEKTTELFHKWTVQHSKPKHTYLIFLSSTVLCLNAHFNVKMSTLNPD